MIKKTLDNRKTPAPFGTGVPLCGGFPLVSLAGVFQPFRRKVEKLRPGVAVQDLACDLVLLTGPGIGSERSEKRTLASVIGTEAEVIVMAGAGGTLFIVGLPPEEEADRFLAERRIGVDKPRQIVAAKPRGVDDCGATPATLKVRAREPRRDLRGSVHDTGTLTVHTENDTTGVRGGEDGNVATGSERSSHREPLSFGVPWNNLRIANGAAESTFFCSFFFFFFPS